MFVMFLQAMATLIVSYALQSLTRPKATIPEAGQLEIPKAKEGDNIPVCFGTVLFKEMNVIWYGGSRVVPIMEKPKKK
jgi:hypothetical protein